MAKNTDGIKPHKWKKGESGNLSGRPKGSLNRSTLVKYWLDAKETRANPITKQIETLDQWDLIILAAIKEARKGNIHAFKELMDSVHGKTKENEGQPIEMIIRVQRNS